MKIKNLNKKYTDEYICKMFRDDVNSCAGDLPRFKESIIKSRLGFYDNRVKEYSVASDGWTTFSCNPADATHLERISDDEVNHLNRKPKHKKKSDVKWAYTRKLGEPLIANIVSPFIMEKGQISIDRTNDRNRVKAMAMEKLLNHFTDEGTKGQAFIKRFCRNVIVDGVAFGKVYSEKKNEEYIIEITEGMYNNIKSSKNSLGDRVEVRKKDGKFYLVDSSNIEKSLNKKTVCPLSIFFDTKHSAMEDKDFFIESKRVTVGDIYDIFGDELGDKALKVAKEEGTHNGKDIKPSMRSAINLYEYWTKLDLDSDTESKTRSRMCRIIIITNVTKGNSLSLVENIDVIAITESPFMFNRISYFRALGLDGDSDEFGDSLHEVVGVHQEIQRKLINASLDDIVSSMHGTTIIRKGLLDTENKNLLDEGASIVEMNRSGGNTNGGIGASLHTIRSNGIPQSTFSMLSMVGVTGEDTSGASSVTKSASSSSQSGSTSNFSVGISLDEVRTSMIISNVKSGLEDQLGMWTDIASVLFDNSEIKKITNFSVEAELIKYADEKLSSLLPMDIDPEDREKLITTIISDERVSWADIMSKFDISIKVGSEATKRMKVASILNLMQQMRELGKALPPRIINMYAGKLAELEGFGDIAKEIIDYSGQEDPYTKQIRELEVAEKSAGIESVVADTKKSLALAENAIKRASAIETKTSKELDKHPEELESKRLENELKAKDVYTDVVDTNTENIYDNQI